ncbi:MAG: hypothetical protein IH880_06960 [Candidatus Marinimicrobia bacterium]|nr:hypothetical protein [Candidatus Neomarinimicrobiota bacterium]
MSDTKKTPDLVLLISLGLGVILFSLNEADTDFFGHLTYGGEILESGSMPTVNKYSYTYPDYPWVNHKWLTSAIFASLNSVFGSGGILILKITIFLMIIGVLNSTIKKIYPGIHPLARFLTLVISSGFLQAASHPRAHIFTYLFTSILLWILYSDYNVKKMIFLLSAIFIPWVNLHGGVIAGYGIFYLWVITKLFQKDGDQPLTKPHLIVISLCLPIFLLINPYGLDLPAQLWTELATDKSMIAEWQPLPLFTWNYLIFKILFAVVIPLSFLWRKEIKPFPTLLAMITFLMSIRYFRHIPFFGISSALILPILFDNYLSRYAKSLNNVTGKFLNSFALFSRLKRIMIIAPCLLIVFLPHVIGYPSSMTIYPPPDFYPIEHVRWLKGNNIKGNLLNSFNWGKYLTYELYPDIKICIDGRLDTAYPEKFLTEYFDFYFGENTSSDFLRKYDHELIMLEPESPQVEKLLSNKNWNVALRTDEAILFVKAQGKNE